MTRPPKFRQPGLFDDASDGLERSPGFTWSIFTFFRDSETGAFASSFLLFGGALKQAFLNIRARSDPKMSRSRVLVKAQADPRQCSLAVWCDGGPAVLGMIERKLYETRGIVSVSRNVSEPAPGGLLVAYYDCGAIWVAKTIPDLNRVSPAGASVSDRRASGAVQLDFEF